MRQQYPSTWCTPGHSVRVRTCTLWHPPQQEARNPPLMEGTTIFLFLFIATAIKRIPQCSILQFYHFKMFIPYLRFELFTLKFAPFLLMCTTNPHGSTVQLFLKTLYHHNCQEDTQVHHNSVEKVKFFNTLPTLNLSNTH